MLDYLIKTRRLLHRMPEIYHKEILTGDFIEQELKSFGIKNVKRIKTGVTAFVGGKDKNTTVALRCDMDALPIHEENDIEYKSQHEGYMHACGHDGHMAMLLAASRLAAEKEPDVNIRFIFQPAEECEGGAEMMIESGVLNGVNAIFGLHLSPLYNKNTLATDGGAIFAGACDFYIELVGKNAHCALKEEGLDALDAGVRFYTRAYAEYKENFSKNCLFHIGKLDSGSASNVVPNSARLHCTFRFFDDAHKESFMMRIEKILVEIFNETHVDHKLFVTNVYPPLVNNSKIAEGLFKDFKELVRCKPIYTAEDFAYYLKQVPGCFVWLGIRDSLHTEPLHSSKFDFDENALICGLDFYKKIMFGA